MALVRPNVLAHTLRDEPDPASLQLAVEQEVRRRLDKVAEYAYSHGADDVEKLIRDFAEQFGEET